MKTREREPREERREERRAEEKRREEKMRRKVMVGLLLNVPATCQCISGTDLLKQLHVLPH